MIATTSAHNHALTNSNFSCGFAQHISVCTPRGPIRDISLALHNLPLFLAIRLFTWHASFRNKSLENKCYISPIFILIYYIFESEYTVYWTIQNSPYLFWMSKGCPFWNSSLGWDTKAVKWKHTHIHIITLYSITKKYNTLNKYIK